jgi:peptide-methionine (S)-S-oxide reductase
MHGRFTWVIVLGLLIAAAAAAWFVAHESGDAPAVEKLSRSPDGPPPAGSEQATFGGGCFWCTQVLFQQLNGVHSTVSGYSGGSVPNPTYEQVCTGGTGHAEAVQITFDRSVISYDELLEVFWRTHDPTTLNRQGHDVGPQYRSVVFYHNAEQQNLAGQYKQKLDASGAFDAPIVTEIVPFTAFYPAETYHQNYFVDHARQPYCATIVGPKLQKFEKVFADKLKPELRGK